MSFEQQEFQQHPSAPTEHGKRQRRDAVLRVLTDLFVIDGERQSAEEREAREDLMLNMVAEAGAVMRREVAERLSAHANPPVRLVHALASDGIDVAGPLIRHSPVLDDQALADIILTGSVQHARAAACRLQPGPLTSEAVIALEDPEALATLVSNPFAELSADSKRHLLATQALEPECVDALLGRDDLDLLDLTTLFWGAAGDQRTAILERLAIAAADEPADPEIAITNAPIRHTDGKSLEAAHKGLTAILQAQRISDFKTVFSRAMGLHRSLTDRIMADSQGEPFAIACCAAGLDQDTFTTMLILHNPEVGRSVQRVFSLGQTYQALSRDLCWRMLEVWNDAHAGRPARARLAPGGAHQLRGAIHEAFAVRTGRADAAYAAMRPAARRGGLADQRGGLKVVGRPSK